MGFGTLALASLMMGDGLLSAAEDDTPVFGPHFPARAKSVIYLFMGGGPSQVDTWDPKPELARLHGRDVPDSIARGVPRIARSRLINLFASPYQFRRRGDSGLPVSELFPETGECIDDLCIIRSCRHDSPIHAPAEYLATTGTQIGDRPSLGAWLTYGLGSPNRDMPGFIVFLMGEKGYGPTWSAGFLPSRFQGTVVAREGVPNLALPPDTTRSHRRAQLELISSLNAGHLARHGGGSDLEARLLSYEMTFRMQAAASEAFDLSRETKETKSLYGIGEQATEEFGTYCLLARRMVERGVRFVQLRFGGWDAHESLVKNHGPQAAKSDRPIAALLKDLKRTGLLESTLVVWGGEFGRTPTAENLGPKPGRDHSPSGYSIWLAGGGVMGGRVIGATDPIGYTVVDRPVHPNDVHATILYALGVDQNKLYFRRDNRKEKATVNGGEVITEVFG